jgi:uncharacterized membrane protein
MEKDRKQTSTARDIVMVGLMSALVFIFTYLHIDIPTPLSNTMIHLGNVMSLLAALLFGGFRGGLAAGFGSMIYDMLDPRYLPTCWLTFIMKFLMGWVAGKLTEKTTAAGRPQYTLAAACGSFTYVVLYVLKTYVQNRLVLGYELETVLTTMLTKGVTSLANGIIAVVFAVLLNRAIRPTLTEAGILPDFTNREE